MAQMGAEEQWKELSTLYSRAKIVKDGGEDLLSCRALFSNDSRWLFVACGSRVKVISLSSREVVHILDHHVQPVTAIAVNPKNHMQLLTASLDGLLIVWDYTDGALLKVIDFSIPLYKFKFRPGDQGPSVYVLIQKDGSSDYVVVGVSSRVIIERKPTVCPKDQLSDGQQFLTVKKPINFSFTHDGSHIVAFSGKKLLLFDIEDESSYSYRSSHTITAVDCHPQKLCIATGNSLGEIQLWYDFARSDTKVVSTTFHWHAHAVADVCFTSDGSYLLSGGEESVLVLWQLDSHKKQFRPRLGSPISKLACCHGDGYFAVSLQSNVIYLLSGLDTEVEHVVGGLRKAYVQKPNESGLKTGLVWCPCTNLVLLNSTPGLLQFYDTLSDSVVRELDIACLNVVSRPDNKPLELTTVDHAAFSPDGQWLATIETRDDKTAPELKMKLWEFNSAHQRYVLNTCVDPPHNDKVTGLTFQPSWKIHSSSSKQRQSQHHKSHGNNQLVHMAITTSLDGRFKSWVLVDVEGENISEEKERKGGKEVHPSWACRSVGYYHNLPCLGPTFCQDGSLLALNFKKFVTVWDPFSCDLLKTLNAPFVYEQFVHVTFGNHSSSQYLLASTTTHLLVWNMLTCTMLWCVKTSVSHLIADPFSSVAVAFVKEDAENTNMYVFSPSCSTPLAVHKAVCQEEVVGAVFIPTNVTNNTMTNHHHNVMKSRLYFMDKRQVLFCLRGDEEEKDGYKDNHFSTNPVGSHRITFTEIFGDTNQRAAGEKYTPRKPPITHQPPKHGSLLDAAPHVLPPMSILCQHYLKSLLPPTQTEKTTHSETSEDELESAGSDDDESSESEGVHSGQLLPQKRQLNGVTEDPHEQRITSCSRVDYSWLIDCFKPL